MGKDKKEEPLPDREIVFDQKPADLEPGAGEDVYRVFENVEDQKGNPGVVGQLRLSNLRLTWIATKKRSLNLSIGLKCIVTITPKGDKLVILTKFNESKFEFSFTAPDGLANTVSACVEGLQAAYQRSKPCRELQLRNPQLVRSNGQLRLQHEEHEYARLENVYNVGSGDSVSGVMTITNVRVVWWSMTKPKAFNVSIPYCLISNVSQVDSKYGPAMSVVTKAIVGSYNLGFRIEPISNLENTVKDLHTFWQGYLSSPVFGIAFNPDDPKAIPPRDESDTDEPGDETAADGGGDTEKWADEQEEEEEARPAGPDGAHWPRTDRNHYVRLHERVIPWPASKETGKYAAT